MSDIIIDDVYVEEIGNFINRQGERFEAFLSEYITILVRVTMEGVKGGRTKESLLQYVELAQQLKGTVGSVSEMGLSISQSYLEDIDAADNFLY